MVPESPISNLFPREGLFVEKMTFASKAPTSLGVATLGVSFFSSSDGDCRDSKCQISEIAMQTAPKRNKALGPNEKRILDHSSIAISALYASQTNPTKATPWLNLLGILGKSSDATSANNARPSRVASNQCKYVAPYRRKSLV